MMCVMFHHVVAFSHQQALPAPSVAASLGVLLFGSGDDAVGNPHRAQLVPFELFELYPLIESRQAVPCRAIRGDSISVNSTLPPLQHQEIMGFGGPSLL